MWKMWKLDSCGYCENTVKREERRKGGRDEEREERKKISESFFFCLLPLPYISKTC